MNVDGLLSAVWEDRVSEASVSSCSLSDPEYTIVLRLYLYRFSDCGALYDRMSSLCPRSVNMFWQFKLTTARANRRKASNNGGTKSSIPVSRKYNLITKI